MMSVVIHQAYVDRSARTQMEAMTVAVIKAIISKQMDECVRVIMLPHFSVQWNFETIM